MFLRAGGKAGLSHSWGLLVFGNLEAQDKQGGQWRPAQVGRVQHPGGLHFPQGLAGEREEPEFFSLLLEKCREQELLAGRNAYQMAGSANT